MQGEELAARTRLLHSEVDSMPILQIVTSSIMVDVKLCEC